MRKVKEKYGTNGVEIPCAKDGITIFLNELNPVKELTLLQLSDIFSGRKMNWKDFGGRNAPIQLYGRENSSGTYIYFKNVVVKTDYAIRCQTLPGTAAVVNAVSKDINAIGYGGAAYAKGVKPCKIKRDEQSPGYEPTPGTVRENLYPITRYLYMYLTSRPAGEVKEFVDWILSPGGQKYVTEIGYFPVK
jgi:phosphate transport system substrate-binding protein